MKKNRLMHALMAIAMIAVMLLAACGKSEPATLEDYLNENSDAKTEIDNAVGSAEEKGVKVDIQGNDIVYTFDMTEMEGATEELVTSDDFKSALQAGIEGQEETFKGIATDISKSTGMKGIRVIVSYNYGDEVLATATFEADSE